jgi:17beta-estradiol 17-dehydrogenase / very-long-chain 3-oxoacyl-CoA reductase
LLSTAAADSDKLQLSKFGPKGSWAVVTGASDGIGKEYAQQLAAKKFNVVLISRTQSKLDALADELSAKYNVQTRVYAMDFAANRDADFAAVKGLIEGLDVSILINNVGFSHSIPVSFLETTPQEMTDIITVNCFGTLKITQIIAPGMVTRKRGLILTMASFGGLLPTPYLATYSGSKAFLQQWSSALASELAPKGVTVQIVQSYLVTSAMSKIRRASAMIPTPKTFVRAALSKVGRSGGAQGVYATSTPYWAHGIYHWFLATVPGLYSKLTIDINRDQHIAIRKRALKKAERLAKEKKGE